VQRRGCIVGDMCIVRCNLRRWAAALAVTLGACLASGCRGGPEDVALPAPPLATEFEDQTPEQLPPGALDAVVALFDPELRLLASGILVGPDRLLTAAHVVAHLPRDGSADRAMLVAGRPERVGIVAIGDADAAHGDWAILALATDERRPRATLHAAALASDWAPTPGTEILLVGFAAGFFAGRSLDLSASPPSVRARIGQHDPDGRRWLADADALDLGGMSGGAAVLWSPVAGRAEVFGVFRGIVGSEYCTTESVTVLGVPVGTEVTRRRGYAFEIHRLPGAELGNGTRQRVSGPTRASHGSEAER